jgi:hypothetical protein
MRTFLVSAAALLFLPLPRAAAYIEAPHSLGRCVHESSTIVLVELVRVNTDKNLLIFKKLADIKGKHPTNEIKHNIGKRGFHEREWKNVMQWAEPGKKAVFMYQGNASETCIGGYWYQCYQEGEWWAMSHAEPFLLRTFFGDPEKLAALCARILKNEEVITTCLADGDKNQLHLRKGKVQRMKASLKKLDYDPKKDFVGWGGDGDEIDEFKTFELMKESTAGWRFLPAKQVKGNDWVQPNFDDSKWRQGKAPVGYGEEEIRKRGGTEIAEKGQDFVFRRVVEVPAELLGQKDAVFRLGIASDDHAVVYLNGQLADKDPVDDHEFAYWNREVELPVKNLRPGRNVIAALVKNKPMSSDLYLDMEFVVQVPLPKKKKTPTAVAVNPKNNPSVTPKDPLVAVEPRDPNALKVDRAARTVTVAAAVAPRKLPNLDQIYPIEVIASWGAPRGQKAHETVVTFKGLTPGDVHKALADLGLKPGKPAYGEGAKAQGPEVRIFLEFTGANGKQQKLPFEKLMVTKDGKPVPELKWHFTGSVMKEPDPEKPVQVYGADLTGTLISIFPVTDSTVFQSHLTMKEEATMKLETNAKLLPKEGTAVKLIIQVP